MPSAITRPELRPAILALMLVLVGSDPVSGQARIRGGYDLTSFFGDGAEGTDDRTELGLGAAFTLVSFGPASISPEVYYRQKGARNVQEFNEQILEGGSAEIGLDYVEIPVLLRVNLPTIGGFLVPYINGGPAFGWRINCSIAFEGETGMAEQMCDDLSSQNIEQTLRDYEVGAAFGAGLDIGILGGVGAINIDARVTQGLSRINEMSASPEVKNRVFSLMLGYSFGIPGGLGIPVGGPAMP